jgi:hypothetical protein
MTESRDDLTLAIAAQIEATAQATGQSPAIISAALIAANLSGYERINQPPDPRELVASFSASSARPIAAS